nr:hypothetical transcript [Hymenolepis microstoma]
MGVPKLRLPPPPTPSTSLCGDRSQQKLWPQQLCPTSDCRFHPFFDAGTTERHHSGKYELGTVRKTVKDYSASYRSFAFRCGLICGIFSRRFHLNSFGEGKASKMR